MALVTVKPSFELGPMFVLAPERYDPRRDSLKTGSGVEETILLGKIASPVRQTINPQRNAFDNQRYVVLDTSDVREGVVIGKRPAVPISELGSTKKRLQRNDVLISRLRPYLRQVAFVDQHILESHDDAVLACSTEFFVLRSNTESSIAFLVPFLLSSPVQKVLSASQEGGHHPRFDEEVLLTLPIPGGLYAARAESSDELTKALNFYRQAERTISKLVKIAESAMAQNTSSVRAQPDLLPLTSLSSTDS